MKNAVLLLASAALAVVFISAISSWPPPTAAQTTAGQPNFVFILTDDMRKDDLKYMPKTRNLIGAQGMTFEKAFVSNSFCCPSRATIMRGQYAHNTGVWGNSDGPDSGWQGYKNHGNEQDNIATRLHDGGYRTGLFGKYFNTYDLSAVPPGWDDWFATQSGGGVFNFYVNDNGTRKYFPKSNSNYVTDVLSRETQSFIGDSVGAGKPFFAYVAPKAPHEPATPAPRHAHAFDGEKAPRLPSFNEEDVRDKPPSIRALSLLSSTQIAQIDTLHEGRAESLQAVDELVEAVVGTLRDKGVLSSTYIFFTSDNGWHEGEHRIQQGKWRPYEEDIHMPLVVRGPGVAAGSTTYKLVLNTDYLPTFTDLAGEQIPHYVDGRSLRPVLDGSVTSWRSAILLEAAANHSQAYRGIRTVSTNTITKRKYVEYAGGARELYNLETDGYELTNSYDAAAPPTSLAMRLQALKVCAAYTCRTAEDGP
jgi:N-acetylglucosamine-6-sulfatase